MTNKRDELAMKMFGRTVTEAHKSCTCVSCGKLAVVFDDPPSKEEYELSGLCQQCQDKVFGKEV